MKLTIIDLLQRNDGVGRQALLGILIQQEGLRSDWPLLRRQHGGVLRGGIHGRHCSVMMRAARRGPSSCGGKGSRSKQPVSDWRCLMCGEGRANSSGHDNQVARE